MTLGFRARWVAALAITAATVAITAGLVHAALLVRSQVADVRDRSEVLANTLAHAIRLGHADAPIGSLRELVAGSPSLRRYAEGVVGYSNVTLYVAIRDPDGIALLHTNPGQEGRVATETELFSEFSKRSAIAQLWSLGRDYHALVAESPLIGADGAKAGTVEVAVSTLFLRHQLVRAVGLHAFISALATLIAFLGSFLLANRLLAPIEQLRAELGRIDPGQGRPRLDLRTRADVSRLIEFFASLSDRVTRAEGEGDGKTSVRGLLAGLGDAVFVLDRGGRIRGGDERAQRLLGSERDLAGRALAELLPAGHPLRTAIDEAREESGGLVRRTVALPLPDGDAPHRLEIHSLQGDAGFLVTIRDVQQVSRLGSQLTHSRRLAALGRLTSGVAHEIRNPLNGLVLQAALLKLKLAQHEEDVRRHVAIVEKEVNNLNRIVDAFLKFMRPEEAPLEPLAIAKVLDATVEVMRAKAEQARVRIEVSVAPGLPPIAGSDDLLRQVFVNLFTNSIDAMPDGGTIRVEARTAGGNLVVAVADDGVGIAAQDLTKVFNLFHTTKEHGTGIGLSLAYRIVQHHGGEIHIESAPGAGTRVILSFPEG